MIGEGKEGGFVACRPDEFHLSTAKACRESCRKGRWKEKVGDVQDIVELLK
jgi:hypothetical protein